MIVPVAHCLTDWEARFGWMTTCRVDWSQLWKRIMGGYPFSRYKLSNLLIALKN